MNITPARLRLAAVILALVPMLMLMSVRTVGIQGPQSASARTTKSKAATVQPIVARRTLTQEQKTAASFAAQQDRSGDVLSPFFADSPGPAPQTPIASFALPPQEPTPPPPDSKAPTVQLTAILVGGRDPLAIINGRPRRIGDEIAPGWTLTHISPADAAITLTFDSDPTRTETTRLNRP